MAVENKLWEKMAGFPEDHKASSNSVPGLNDRQDMHAEPDDAELNDTSTILNGAKAITGKAVYSANQAGRNSDQSSAQESNKEKNEAKAREMLELMKLAAWNAEKTFVGGVEMTNEEAQNARQHIIDNADDYANRAVKEGRINASQREEYKEAVRRIKELEDKKGRGTISDDEKQECERLKLSRAGQAAEHDAGRYHQQMKGYEVSSDVDNSARRQSSPAIVDNSLFQSAPDLSDNFTKANAATEPLDKKESPVAAPLAPKVAATGLAI